jgi:hypothetical protein
MTAHVRKEDETAGAPRLPTVLGGCAEMRRKPGTDTKFPARFAGNWLSVPGFAPRETLRLAVSPQNR